MIRKEIINYTAVSSRIINIKIKPNPLNITTIQVYAHTSFHSGEYIKLWRIDYESVNNTI